MKLIGKVTEVSLDKFAHETPTPTRVCVEFSGSDASGQEYSHDLVIYARNQWGLRLNDVMELELRPVTSLGETIEETATSASAA